jgi:hypothetical protein
VKGPLHVDESLLPFAHVTLHEAGVNEYGSAPGPVNAGESVSPEQDQVAADAVPIGLRKARARSSVELFGPRVFSATPEPLLLLSEPLTTLTATSEPVGLVLPPLEDDEGSDGEELSTPGCGSALEHANVPHARRAIEANRNV